MNGFAVAVLLAALPAPADDPKEGFVPLFNGKDLSGWKPDVKAAAGNPFAVKDGVIAVSGGGGKLLSAASYQDFELRLEFRFVDKASDSGVFLRMAPGGGYQVQTKPHAGPKGLGEVRGGKKDTLDLKHDTDAVKKAMKPVGEWQTYAITVRDTRAEVWLNGVPVCTADGLKSDAGPIGFQAEYGKLEYRNVRIKPLPLGKKP